VKAQVLSFDAPADARGDVFAPGCLKAATVPVILGFDPHTIIGLAEIAEDGSAELTIAEEAGSVVGEVGIGFVAERWREEGGIRIVEQARPLYLGVSVSNRGLESQVCPDCRQRRFIIVRSIDNKFWCKRCKAWKPCAAKESHGC
jgi:hypothetical protein